MGVQIFLQEKKRLVESFKRLWMKLPKTILVKRTKKRKKVRRRIMLQRKMAKQSPSRRPNRSQNPKRKQLLQKRKRKPNLKNASAHLSLQKVSQKATLAKKKIKVVTLNHPKGSTNPRKLPVEGFVDQQQKNGKGVDQIPRGRTTVVLLLTKKNSMKTRPHPLLRKREARKADPQQNPSMWTRILTKILTNPRKDWTLTLIKQKI